MAGTVGRWLLFGYGRFISKDFENENENILKICFLSYSYEYI